MLHRIAHWFGWQRGFVVSAYGKSGVLWMGHRCAKCGKLSSVAPSVYDRPHPSEFRP
jgi:hypothetical protein